MTGTSSRATPADLAPVPRDGRPPAEPLNRLRSAYRRLRRQAEYVAVAGAIGGVILVSAVVLLSPGEARPTLVAGAAIAVAAGLAATSIGVFGAVLVPGLLLLGVEPRVAAPLSLLIQVIVIPLGASTHAAVGHVRREITLPLIVGGVVGSVGGALLASSVPADVVGRAVALVIVIVGILVLATLRTGNASGTVATADIPPARVGGIGVAAGFASGISGAGWGPIGVKLLILSRIDPRHAIGSSLVGRVFMAVAAIGTYMVSAAFRGGFSLDLALLAVLLIASTAAMLPGTLLVARMGRQSASAVVALLSIGLAMPSLLPLR